MLHNSSFLPQFMFWICIFSSAMIFSMQKDAKIYVAGHRGLVGSAIMRALNAQGYANIIVRGSFELDLRNQQAVNEFFEQERPEYVFLAAAKVGGIHANNIYPAQFIYDNITIQTNIIHAAYMNNVKKLLFFRVFMYLSA